ncbi:MAG: hypothetical protein MZU91_13060 [Desulfosudis oleivorans]|nr:hypothetical protein [Desulfosudis oleivorans]
MFVCHCGINARMVDVPKVVEYAGLPPCHLCRHERSRAPGGHQVRMKEVIKEHQAQQDSGRFLHPKDLHEPLFQDTMKEAGLNPHLFEMANLGTKTPGSTGDTGDGDPQGNGICPDGSSKAAELRAVSHKTVPVTERSCHRRRHGRYDLRACHRRPGILS